MNSGGIPSVTTLGNYSTEELEDIYALGRMWLETGQVRRAEVVMHGLNIVAPQFFPAWLGTALVQSTLGNIEAAYEAARQALKIAPQSAEAMIFVAMAALALNDVSTAGTFLGEVGDLVEQGTVSDPNVVRLYKMQLARYQGRTR